MEGEPDNMVIVLLRELRHDMNTRFNELESSFSGLEREVSSFSEQLAEVRKFAAGDSVMGRFAVAGFEKRLDELQERVASLEAR